jgi:hypothetical protein
MELKRALELRTEYAGKAGVIRVDNQDFICLNEMLAFFPNKSMDKWAKAEHTKEFVLAVEKEFQIPPNGGIIAKRGKAGGTWAHPMIAFEFATWLSPEFKLKVYREYIEGTQNKKGWNIKRIMAADNFKFMTEAVKNDHAEPKHYHFSNEARMINQILFGEPSFDREEATEFQLDQISWAERANGVMIEMCIDYQERKSKLADLFIKKNTVTLTNQYLNAIPTLLA